MMTITGIMRSATSLAALTANQSGVLMGSSMVIPYGDLNEEYEDLALAIPLTRAVFSGAPFDPARAFGEYVQARQAEHERSQEIFDRPAWGFKSPLLMLYWDEWQKSTEGIPNVVVLTKRCLKDSMQSLKRGASSAKGTFAVDLLKRYREVERDLYAARNDVDADFLVTYDALRADAPDAMNGAIGAARE